MTEVSNNQSSQAINPFAASAARHAQRIDDEMAKGFRSNMAGVVAAHLGIAFGIRTCPARQGTKRPWLEGWQDRATANLNSIVFWVRRFERPDFIVPTGSANGIVILDVDGPRGRARMAELETKHGALPPTWMVISGREEGGFHLWFRAPKGRELKSVGKALIGGKRDCIDQKGRGGYAVIPGSLHASGRRYQWAEGRAPNEVELAELPEEWLAVLDWADEPGTPPSPKLKTQSEPHRAPVKRDYAPMSRIFGDSDGQGGFQNPAYLNALDYFRKAGVEASAEKLIAKLWQLIQAAPKADGRSVERYRPGNGDLERAVERARQYIEHEKGHK